MGATHGVPQGGLHKSGKDSLLPEDERINVKQSDNDRSSTAVAD